MQPTYLPWIGYFSMIDRVDEFVFFDCVQFNKRSWQQRNYIKGQNGAQWLSVPVLTKGLAEQRIHDVRVDQSRDFIKQHLKKIEFNYKKAPYFDYWRDILWPLYHELEAREELFLADVNVQLVQTICTQVGIDTLFSHSKDLSISGKQADRLAAICLQRNATTYLSAPGSKAYIEQSDVFIRSGIQVAYHEYNPVEYSQINGDFLPYMSIIDVLCHVAPEQILAVIRAGVPRKSEESISI